MSQYTGPARCPQCGFEETRSNVDTRERSGTLICWMCGYVANYSSPRNADGEFICDSGGEVLTSIEKHKGFDVFVYASKECCASVSIMTEDIANDVKADLEKALAEGELEESPLYVTRWNEESKKADVILGTFKEVWQRRIMVCPSLDRQC
jgi:transcription elongation factor Elf1